LRVKKTRFGVLGYVFLVLYLNLEFLNVIIVLVGLSDLLNQKLTALDILDVHERQFSNGTSPEYEFKVSLAFHTLKWPMNQGYVGSKPSPSPKIMEIFCGNCGVATTYIATKLQPITLIVGDSD
jgi:hypothetical protein